jgi:hypothetical protein
VNRGEILAALIESGRLSIIPVGFTGERERERESVSKRERGGERMKIQTKAKCVECNRVFDLLSEEEASEWAYGHDCES